MSETLAEVGRVRVCPGRWRQVLTTQAGRVVGRRRESAGSTLLKSAVVGKRERVAVKRAVFLDRDGVLVETDVREGAAYAVTTLAEFRVVPEAAAQVARLRAAGLVCVVFTNQPEVARGTIAPAVIEAMHGALRAALPVDDVFVCPHDDADDCACRKPRPGMLQEAAARWDVGLADSFVIGDRWRDIDAGRAAGCYTVLLEREYSGAAVADARVATLTEAVDVVLAQVGDAPNGA